MVGNPEAFRGAHCSFPDISQGYALAGHPTVNPGFSGAFNGGSGDFFVTAFQSCVGQVAPVVTLPACGLPPDPDFTLNPPMIGQVARFQVTSAFPAALGWIFMSLGTPPPIAIPGSGCTVWVDVFNPTSFYLLSHFITNAQGGYTLDIPLPYDPAFLGLTFTFQTRLCPPLGPPGPLFPDWISNGLRATIGCP